MKGNLRVASIAALTISIPALIIIDWYFTGFGILGMFALLTLGLVLDQAIRLKFPVFVVSPQENYRKNRILNIFALVLFLQSPMALIFGNRYVSNFGFWIAAVMVCLGITLNQTAKHKYPYATEKGRNLQ
jgi:hypothetical protein